MPDFTEKKLVEDYFIEQLQQKGWCFIEAEKLERESYEEVLLLPNLIRAIERINKERELSEEEINKVINELKCTATGVEGAKRILYLYKLGVPIKFEKEKIIGYIQLFDYEHLENNEFIVTSQANYDGRERVRTDLILYVNGIPLVSIECKNPARLTESWYKAFVQIKEYEQTVPELYKYVQVGVAAESEAHYFPIVSWQQVEEVKTHLWRENNKDSIDATIEMLAPAKLLDIIKHFLFFRIERGTATKVITRYMQYRAANRMVHRVLANLNGETEKDKGLIWHWQGSGKTLTMIFAANKLYFNSLLANPTIFFIVDRIELEEQLYAEFYSLDMVRPEIIGSVSELKNVLSADDYRGKRGVFILLIHKFRPEEVGGLQKEIEEISKTKETIMNRKNVITFIDEGHRSQYGMLAAQMRAILKSSFFFALTGTPIAKEKRDTYQEFSYPPKEPYLDRYFIVDSIKDGFTVKIAYQPRLEEKVHLKKEQLTTFIEVEFEEIPENYREEVKGKVQQRLNEIELFLENPARINVIAGDIAEHFKEHIDGKFKAMVVAASRKACVLYKEALSKYLPREYIEVVMSTVERGEEPIITDYIQEARERYHVHEMEQIRRTAIEKFKEDEFPKILIVTDMLLTGFDAPILQVMYLDKPLKEHRLLQAIARTNRPYKDRKEAGLIIDYVGILKEFKKALEMYSEDEITGVLVDYTALEREFVFLIKDIFNLLKDVPRNYERDTLLKAVEVLTSDERLEKEFRQKYRNLRKLFELLGPREIKLNYFEDYKWLSAVFVYYMKLVNQEPAVDRYTKKYYDKTLKYVHKSTEVTKIEKELPTIAFDENYLTKLSEKVKGKKQQVASIIFTLNRLTLVEKHRSPIYESLIEKVEHLLKLWQEKTKDYEQLYLESVETVKKALSLGQRQKSLGFNDLEYSLLLTLEKALNMAQKTTSEKLIKEVKAISKSLNKYMFAGWLNQITAKREVEREVRKFTRRLKKNYNLSMGEMDSLYNALMRNVRDYGTS